MLIDDFSHHDLVSKLGTHWRGVSDKVMGGISESSIAQGVVDDLTSLHLTGDVCLENNGGFIQAALDLTNLGETFDASDFSGIRLSVRGNGEPPRSARRPANSPSYETHRDKHPP